MRYLFVLLVIILFLNYSEKKNRSAQYEIIIEVPNRYGGETTTEIPCDSFKMISAKEAHIWNNGVKSVVHSNKPLGVGSGSR